MPRARRGSGAAVIAREVVVATHYPVFDRSMLFSRLMPRRELVAAGQIAAASDPGGMYITPEQHTRSVRSAPSGGRRLLIVTGEAFGPGARGVKDRLLGWPPGPAIASHRPDRYHWAAQDNGSSDRLPYVGRSTPAPTHLRVAAGFGGWGMSGGVMSGRLLAALLGGPPPPLGQLFDPRRLPPAVEAGPLLRATSVWRGVSWATGSARPRTPTRPRRSHPAPAP